MPWNLGGDFWLTLSSLMGASIKRVVQFDGCAASARSRLVRTQGVGVDIAPIAPSELRQALANVTP